MTFMAPPADGSRVTLGLHPRRVKASLGGRNRNELGVCVRVKSGRAGPPHFARTASARAASAAVPPARSLLGHTPSGSAEPFASRGAAAPAWQAVHLPRGDSSKSLERAALAG